MDFLIFKKAAIIHYLDPTWRAAEVKEWTETLIKDVNNPVEHDPRFAQYRNWDWFAGHSWAGGIKVNGALDGRDQESVPEVCKQLEQFFSFKLKLLVSLSTFIGEANFGVLQLIISPWLD